MVHNDPRILSLPLDYEFLIVLADCDSKSGCDCPTNLSEVLAYNPTDEQFLGQTQNSFCLPLTDFHDVALNRWTDNCQ